MANANTLVVNKRMGSHKSILVNGTLKYSNIPAKTIPDIMKSKKEVAIAERGKTSLGISIFFIKLPLDRILGPHLLIELVKKVQGTRAE